MQPAPLLHPPLPLYASLPYGCASTLWLCKVRPGAYSGPTESSNVRRELVRACCRIDHRAWNTGHLSEKGRGTHSLVATKVTRACAATTLPVCCVDIVVPPSLYSHRLLSSPLFLCISWHRPFLQTAPFTRVNFLPLHLVGSQSCSDAAEPRLSEPLNYEEHEVWFFPV